MHQSTPTTNPKDVDRSCFTGMAQRQRARLITARSLDRNGLPVYHHHIAPVHQGTRASIPCSAAEARRKTPSVTNKI